MVAIEEAYVGMRVMAHSSEINDGLDIEPGELGTVCDLDTYDEQIGVEWDAYHGLCHECEGNCEDGHGWYVYPQYLDPVDPGEPLPDFEVSDTTPPLSCR